MIQKFVYKRATMEDIDESRGLGDVYKRQQE